MNNVVDLEAWRVAHSAQPAGQPSDSAEWRRFVEAVARDVVEHLPDVVPWKHVPEVLGLPAAGLWAAALSGGLTVGRVDGVLFLLVRDCESVLIELMSVRLAVPRPLATSPDS